MAQPPAGVGHDPGEVLTRVLSEAASTLFAAGSLQDTLTHVVQLAVATSEGCDYAGIFLMAEGSVSTVAHTESLVMDVDALQQRFDEGPCLDAIRSETSFYAQDLTEDERWPRFGPEAAAMGIRSCLALPLLATDIHGALNLYSRFPRAFGAVDRARGLLLAALAAPASSAAQRNELEAARAEHLLAALNTRAVIGQAQGILIERERITAEQAFDILRRASQQLNLKLREVAQTLVETGEIPEN